MGRSWLLPLLCSLAEGLHEFSVIGEGYNGNVTPIRIGTLLTLEQGAPMFPMGRDMARSMEMYVRQINDIRGGVRVNGQRRSLALWMLDDNGNASLIPSAVDELASLGIKLFVGPFGAALAEAAAGAVHRNGLTMMGPCCQNPAMTQGRPRVFSVETRTDNVLPKSFELLSRHSEPPKTVAYVYQTDHPRWGQICSAVPVLAQQYGMVFLGSAEMSAKRNDTVSTAVAKLAGLQPDVVFGCMAGLQGGNLCLDYFQEAERQQFNTNATVVTICSDIPSFFETYRDRVRHTISVNPWDRDLLTPDASGWTAQLFGRLFFDFFGDVPHLAASTAWIAISNLVEAIEGANSEEAGPVADWLRARSMTQPLRTIYGDMWFEGGLSATSWPVFQIQAEGVVRLTPDPMADFYYPTPKWSKRHCHHNDLNGGLSDMGYLNDTCQSCIDATNESSVALFDRVRQVRECKECPSGKQLRVIRSENFDEVEAAWCQVQCPPGYAGRTQCIACPVGKYEEKHECEACEAGTFSDMEGATECKQCPTGTFSSLIEATACELCAPGTSNAVTASLWCLSCSRGKVTSKNGALQCELCQPGHVARNEGMSLCDACPAGHRSLWGSRACEKCPVGTYQDQLGNDSCIDDGAGQLSRENGTVIPSNKEGYWSAGMGQMETCKFDPAACLEESKCLEGHTGRQCLTCLPGYVRGKTQCFKCAPRWLNVGMTFFMWFGAIGMGLLLCRFITSSVGRPQDTILVVLFKLMVNHCVSMSVAHTVLINILREANFKNLRQDGGIDYIWWGEFFAGPLNFFDGVINTETQAWSLSCLVQASLDSKFLDELVRANHTAAFLSVALQPARTALENSSLSASLLLLVFFFSWPMLYVMFCNFIGMGLLYANVKRHKDLYEDAFIFYKDVKEQGFKNVEKKYMERKRKEYIDAYFYRINGIWSPVSHVLRTQAARSHDRRGGTMISVDLYQEESLIIKTLATFCCYAPTCRGLVKPLLCVKLGEAASTLGVSYLTYYHAGLPCTAHGPVLYLSAALAFMWLVLFPAHHYWRLWQVHTQLHLPKIVREFGFATCGYRWDCWWWDPVVFIRKGILFVIEVMPFIKEEERIMILLVLAIVFFVMELIFSPYDDRCNGLFHRLELVQLALFLVYIMSSLLLFSVLGDGAGSGAGVTVIVLAATMSTFHALYILKICFYFVDCFLDMVVNQIEEEASRKPKKPDDSEAPKPTYVQQLVQYVKDMLVSWHNTKMRDSAYVSFDQLYGWISICGTHGDMAVPPYIPKGEMAKHFKEKRPLLSEAPMAPDVDPLNEANTLVELASSSQRQELKRMLCMTVNHLAASHESGPAFSLSVFEFVVRVAFTLCKGDQSLADPTEQDAPQEVDRKTWTEAVIKKDPLTLKQGEDEVEAEGGEEEREYVSRALLMEEDLQKAFSEARAKAHEQQGGDDDLKNKGKAFRCYRSLKMMCLGCCACKRAKEKTEQDMEIERNEADVVFRIKHERYTAMVHTMFTPSLYRRGLSLAKMQFALMHVQSLPRQDLMIWLDLFERQWLHERSMCNRQLRRMAGMTVDRSEESIINVAMKRKERRDPTMPESAPVVTFDQEVQAVPVLGQSMNSAIMGGSIRRSRQMLSMADENSEAAEIYEDPDPSFHVALRWMTLMTNLTASVSIHSLLAAMNPHHNHSLSIHEELQKLEKEQRKEEEKIAKLMAEAKERNGPSAAAGEADQRPAVRSNWSSNLQDSSGDEAPELPPPGERASPSKPAAP